MAMLPDVFKASETEDVSFDVLPAGKYLAEICKSEMKDTKDKTGKYLSVQIKIIDGKYAKRLVFDMFNLVNKNPQAVQIARGQFKSLVEATGNDEVEDSAELHGIPICIRLGIQAETAQWPAKNTIKKYMLEDEYEPEEDDD